MFITDGTFAYQCDEVKLVSTPRRSTAPRRTMNVKSSNSAASRNSMERFFSDSGIDFLEKGDIVSEAALWTTWEHQGVLVCTDEALVMSMDSNIFAEEITRHKRATAHAARYARHFCWRLCRADFVTDLVGFDLPMAALDVELYVGGLYDHYAFISHYKMEAGSEAAMMRTEMERIIRKDHRNEAGDLRSPIFVDSEDLADLSTLSNHVTGSLSLIVLLTPGLLSRPYCLLEIICAKRAGRPYVPVQIVRPGISQYIPDEEFYQRLHRGEIIGAEGCRILEDNGSTLQETEDAIRSVFKMIALPYSPQKSEAVRKAEIEDILKRCMVVTAPQRTTGGMLLRQVTR